MQRWILMFMIATSVSAKDISFELVNQTGFELVRVWVSKAGVGAWNIVDGKPIPDKGSVQVTLVNKADWHVFDLRVAYVNGKKKRWEVFDALELPTFKRVTLSVVSGDKWNAHYEQ